MNNYDEYVLAALVEEGITDADAADRAKRHASQNQTSALESLVTLGLVRSRDIALTRATISEYPFVDIDKYEIDIGHTRLLPRSVAERHLAFPLFAFEGSLTVGMADPLDLRAVDRIRSLIGSEIEPVLCEPDAIHGLIRRAYSLAGQRGADADTSHERTTLTSGEEPIVAAVNHILASAVEKGASDVHLSPDDHELSIRFRLDGILQSQQGPSRDSHAGMVQRIKVMSGLDLTQSRRPQDGKFRFEHGGRRCDVRVSLLPTVCGENVVMRILESHATARSFRDLGMPEEHISALDAMIAQPYGMLLVTGPTGSGKTTTLYAAVSRLNSPDRNVMTIEDPVELRLPGVRQTQVHTEIGMTFAGALRSVLRQDPDVILLGEIRDEETSRIALQSALTGHLVLSTLHTNDAPGSIPRLKDLACPPFAINAALLGVIAQRLVRRACDQCSVPHAPEPALLRQFGLAGHETGFIKPTGCARCSNAGYRGRSGVYEVLTMTPEIRDLVDSNASPSQLRALAIQSGMRPMWHCGLDLARMGSTTLQEVTRVVAIGDDEVNDVGELRISA